MDLTFLNTLEGIIERRADDGNPESYTVRLLEAGPQRIAQKVGEEGVELALAGVTGDRDELLGEAADLLYHLLVLLHSRGVSLAEVVAVLEARHARDDS
jgi:phosphoribosyl-ATP pyrophosphohydrolase/phosphoribosyl-AMP cyclohydrolase